MWKLSGTADYDVDFTVVANVSENEDEAVDITTHCTGVATYQVEALIFKDVVISLE